MTMHDFQQTSVDLAHKTVTHVKHRLEAVIRGRSDVIDLVLIALVADGHVLLEDFPGSGKTTLARALGECFEPHDVAEHIAVFRRIQFTPDLLPSDITGTNVFDVTTNGFVFRRGPLFAHVVLADEINRTSPKVQSAMLEAMAEKQITIDESSHPLDGLFFVIATQNPIDLAGTYPLPTPQLDRFLFKITMTHVAREAELDVLASYPSPSLGLAANLPRITRTELLRARAAVREAVHIAPASKEALVDLARAIRADERVEQGVSTRSLVLMMPALQARAILAGRDHVSPDDVAALAGPVFSHRIVCRPGIDDPAPILKDALKPIIDRLAKQSLKRA
jgi:MoxR-like ATPase